MEGTEAVIAEAIEQEVSMEVSEKVGDAIEVINEIRDEAETLVEEMKDESEVQVWRNQIDARVTELSATMQEIRQAMNIEAAVQSATAESRAMMETLTARLIAAETALAALTPPQPPMVENVPDASEDAPQVADESATATTATATLPDAAAELLQAPVRAARRWT